jgi:purine-nucleoside phosphorylase
MINMDYDQVQAAAAALTAAIAPRRPVVGLVLGSGLGSFADGLDDRLAVSYGEIPGFAQSKVKGHAGQFVAGTCQGVQVLAMQGRVHCYEGHPIGQVVLPVRTMITAGCKTLIITNAAGGIRDDLTPGNLAVITDHINLTGLNPLAGANEDRLGPRFPDMSEAYAPALRELARRAADVEGIAVTEGIYGWMLGPSYETPAEIRMLGRAGADLAGMSTVPEVIAANHMGARVLGISCVTNMAAGRGGKLSHDEVKETAERVKHQFVGLLTRTLQLLAPELKQAGS